MGPFYTKLDSGDGVAGPPELFRGDRPVSMARMPMPAR